MEINDLKKYLKEIITLESAAFEYSQYVSAAEKNTVFHKPQKKVFNKPVLNMQEAFDSAAYSRDVEQVKKRYSKYYWRAMSICMICYTIYVILFRYIHRAANTRTLYTLPSGLTATHYDEPSSLYWILPLLVVVSIFVFICVKIWGRRKEELSDIKEGYMSFAKISAEKEYKSQMAEYNKNVTEAEEEYRIAYEKEQQCSERAKGVLEILKTQFDQIDSILKKYYDMDVIFPKYRNFSAVCSFYEYLMTERCSELTGPNGAYNLYETERTMGHIVNAVDNIANMTVEALNMMKENQYYYYTEMRAINDHLNVFALQLDKLLTSGANANDYFMQIADNTKALTYDSAAMLAGFGY